MHRAGGRGAAARFLAALLLLGACSCASQLGPRHVVADRIDYNEAAARSLDQQMLLNLVRLRYNHTPLFLELGSVVTQYSLGRSIELDGSIEQSDATTKAGGLGLSGAYAEHPTLSFTPLQGEDFAGNLLTPIPNDALVLFAQTGWSIERLLLICAQQVNDVLNAPSATGPTPDRPPEYESFADLAARMRRLQRAGLLVMTWEPTESGHASRLSLHDARGSSELAADLAAIKRTLGVPDSLSQFRITNYPSVHAIDEVGFRNRSLLAVLYFLSQSVELPAEHEARGLAMVTRDEGGTPFDWTLVTGKLLRIHASKERPEGAYVAVPYLEHWFYIADDDPNSKATFTLLNVLFSLQSASGHGKTPVLTLPVGQ